ALVALLKPTADQADAQERLGVMMFDSEGRMRSLVEIVETLQREGADATDILTAFGIRGGRAIGALVGQGDALRNQINVAINSSGVAAEQAAKRMEGFEGAMKGLRSAIEGLALAIAESGILEMVTDLVVSITAWVRELAASNPELLRWGFLIGAAVAVIGPLLIVLGLMASALGAILPIIGVVGGAILALGLPVLALIAAFVAGGVAVFVFRDEIISAFKTVGEFIAEVALDVARSIGRMINDLIEGAKNIANFVSFGLGFGGGGGGRVSNPGPNPVPLVGFANGGSFTVGGNGGVDSQMVQFMATPGEHVTVQPSGASGSTFNIDARGGDLGLERRIERSMGRAVKASRIQAGSDFANALAGAGA
ncbi:hypothetical protein LCGC14_0626000, partial [marine sediment metagenome]